jgi:bloom syndrome protein
VRKNENLHALYSILEFCEEPHQCRRKMLLNFLGEEFDYKECNRMCDNCKKGMDVIEKDFTKEAKLVLMFVQDMENNRTSISMK